MYGDYKRLCHTLLKGWGMKKYLNSLLILKLEDPGPIKCRQGIDWTWEKNRERKLFEEKGIGGQESGTRKETGGEG